MLEISREFEAIETRDDLIRALKRLMEGLYADRVRVEHETIPDYVEAYTAYVESIPNLYKNQERDFPNNPTWKLVGELLFGALIYE